MVSLSEDPPPPPHSSLYPGWVMLNIYRPFVLTMPNSHDDIQQWNTWRHADTCHVSSHTSAAPLFSQIRPLILTTVCKAAVIPRPVSVNITDRSDLRRRCYCSLTRITKKLHQGQRTLTRKWVSVNKSIRYFPSFSLQFPVHARKNCFELHPTLTGITVLFAFACLLIRLSIIVLKESALFHIKLLKSQSQT